MAGLIKMDGSGYAITNFMEEQGPGQDEIREKWRERQDKHRKKLTNISEEVDSEKELDSEIEKKKEGEEEKESHRDVTVTHPTSTPDNSPEKVCINNVAKRIGLTADISRIDKCFRYYARLAKENNWNPLNEKAIMDLYPSGMLEKRREREDRREEKLDKDYAYQKCEVMTRNSDGSFNL